MPGQYVQSFVKTKVICSVTGATRSKIMLEHEQKYLVSKSDFDRILSQFHGGVSKTQINHYYDTADFCYRKSNTTIRVRDGVCVKKEHLSGGESVETVIDLPDDLICYGSLTTFRTSFLFERLKIEFDQSEYLDVADYEIEIEYDENSKQQALELADKLGLTDKNTTSKSERFFAKL